MNAQNAYTIYGKENEKHTTPFCDMPGRGCVDCAWFKENSKIQCSKIIDQWDEFGDVAMNPETECIEKEWNGFPAGTHREEIWHWFEETYRISVNDLLYP